jgi:hypothetical protein
MIIISDGQDITMERERERERERKRDSEKAVCWFVTSEPGAKAPVALQPFRLNEHPVF